ITNALYGVDQASGPYLRGLIPPHPQSPESSGLTAASHASLSRYGLTAHRATRLPAAAGHDAFREERQRRLIATAERRVTMDKQLCWLVRCREPGDQPGTMAARHRHARR